MKIAQGDYRRGFYIKSQGQLHLLSTYTHFITPKRTVTLNNKIWASSTESSSSEYSEKPWE